MRHTGFTCSLSFIFQPSIFRKKNSTVSFSLSLILSILFRKLHKYLNNMSLQNKKELKIILNQRLYPKTQLILLNCFLKGFGAFFQLQKLLQLGRICIGHRNEGVFHCNFYQNVDSVQHKCMYCARVLVNLLMQQQLALLLFRVK